MSAGMRKCVILMIAAVALAGCAAPPLRSYLLTATPGTNDASGIAMPLSSNLIEVRPVLLPDHLDTHDLQRRTDGDRLVRSRNGRWADRLSVAIRDTLASDLRVKLPDAAIVTTSPLQPGFRRISLTITSFDIDESGRLTLDASWTEETTRPPGVCAGRRIMLVETGIGPSDDDQARAMSRLLDRLADAIAAAHRTAL